MNSLRTILYLFALCIFNCASNKNQASPSEIAQLNKLVEEQAFEINSDWALPMSTNSLVSLQNAGFFPPGSSAGQINLIGNPNYFRIKGDSVSSELPYYGEVQFSSGHYGGESGIELRGVIKDLDIEKNEKNMSYKLRFKASSEEDNYNIFLTLFPNGRSTLRINGNNRFPIEYTGNFSQLSDDAKADIMK